jgi:aminoglycoside phosphotransferase (APT) family kinase protein
MEASEKYLDKAAEVRAGDEIKAEAVSAFAKDHIPGLQGEMKITQFKGGASNLTYQLDFDNASLILRCPPAGTKAKSAHDMGREYNVMQKLKPVYPYVPDMIAFCKDESLIGREFYIMEKLTGVIPRANLPKGMELTEEQVRKLCTNVIDKMIELHKVDYQAAGLAELGKGSGYVQRQISGWTDRYAKAKTDNVPDFARVIQWLNENMPQDIATCVIHGDFRFDNVVLDPYDITKVIGVLDWEMATLGDPLMDLGNSLAYWVETGDSFQMQMSRRQPTHLPGMMTRDEVVGYYCAAMGYKNVDFTFYRIYGLFRLAAIAQQIYYRFHHGQTDNQLFGSFYVMVQYLNEYCEELLDKK